MLIHNSHKDVPANLRGAVIALGNFDGVHLGHRAVIGKTLGIAAETGAPSAVLTFDPHPRRYFRPDDPFFELTPGEAKARPLSGLGLDGLFILKFDADIATLSAEDFVETVLVGGLGISHVVVGYDFLFGKGRLGDAALLQRLGAESGFGVTVLEAVHPDENNELPYSSTTIRDHLRSGRIAEAAAMLGYPWEIEGVVMTGDQRGRQIGFPTANVDPGTYLNPALGVYACWVALSADETPNWRKAVVNIGRRPTFNGEGVTVEAHLFDFDGDLYGQKVRVVLAGQIRPEMKFDGFEAIRAQIALDCDAARVILDRTAPGGIDPQPEETPGGAEK